MKLAHILCATALAFLASAQAQPSAIDDGAHRLTSASTAVTPTTDGEVRKVDKEQGKITLRHGRIENLDMPGMTMVFRVVDPKMLDNIKPGDKVRFAADNINGALTVTAIEIAR